MRVMGDTCHEQWIYEFTVHHLHTMYITNMIYMYEQFSRHRYRKLYWADGIEVSWYISVIRRHIGKCILSDPGPTD